MDDRAQTQDRKASPLKKMPGSDHAMPSTVLLIGPSPALHLYTDDVLRQAGFGVRTMTPWDVREMVGNEGRSYALAVFSNALHPREVSDIAKRMHRCSPKTKLLLMLGRDPMPVDFSLFDATLDTLEGPVALIRTARNLANASVSSDIADVGA